MTKTNKTSTLQKIIKHGLIITGLGLIGGCSNKDIENAKLLVQSQQSQEKTETKNNNTTIEEKIFDYFKTNKDNLSKLFVNYLSNQNENNNISEIELYPKWLHLKSKIENYSKNISYNTIFNLKENNESNFLIEIINDEEKRKKVFNYISKFYGNNVSLYELLETNKLIPDSNEQEIIGQAVNKLNQKLNEVDYNKWIDLLKEINDKEKVDENNTPILKQINGTIEKLSQEYKNLSLHIIKKEKHENYKKFRQDIFLTFNNNEQKELDLEYEIKGKHKSNNNYFNFRFDLDHSNKKFDVLLDYYYNDSNNLLFQGPYIKSINNNELEPETFDEFRLKNSNPNNLIWINNYGKKQITKNPINSYGDFKQNHLEITNEPITQFNQILNFITK